MQWKREACTMVYDGAQDAINPPTLINIKHSPAIDSQAAQLTHTKIALKHQLH